MELAGNQTQRPLITFYGPAGERVELSARTLQNWQCKLANLYRYQYGVDQASTVAVRPFPHWAIAPIVAAVGWVGAQVTLEADANPECALAIISDQDLSDLPPATEVTVASQSLLAEPMTELLPVGVDDLFADVRMQPDQFGQPVLPFPNVLTGADSAVAPLVNQSYGQRPLIVGWQNSNALSLIHTVSYLPCVTGTPIVWVPDASAVDLDRVSAQERTDVVVRL